MTTLNIYSVHLYSHDARYRYAKTVHEVDAYWLKQAFY